uniref:MAGE domain-containing protein n=1 Tax=Arcella intermedia TaxID=1963864 RepID=A0A6B2LEV3_9EUKA
MTTEELNKMVADTVRYCLFLDQQKKPIKKGDITKHVTKDYKGISAQIIQLARQKLLDVFGYDLVEVWRMSIKEGHPIRKVDSGTYILHNTLPSNMEIDEKFEDAKVIALLFIILGLIFINRTGLEKGELNSYLNSILPDADPAWRDNVIDKTLVSQLYLEKVKTTTPDGKEIFTYHMGARSELEIGKLRVLEFVSVMFGESKVDPSMLKEVEDEIAAEKAKTVVEEENNNENQEDNQEEETQAKGKAKRKNKKKE